MPSPLVHSAAGYVVYRYSKANAAGVWKKRIGPFSFLLVVTLVFSVLPDLDAIPGLLSSDFAKYHNNGTHSLVVGLLIASLFSLAISWKRREEFTFWFLVVGSSYGTHILLDFFTWGGRGVMLLWPFSLERYHSSLVLFYGVRWGDGLLSINHIWTLLTEGLFILLFLILAYFSENRSKPVSTRETCEQIISGGD